MDAFLVPRTLGAQTREARLAAQAELEAECRADASRLGLPWPRPREMRRPGRPSRQQLYNDALYQCISKRTLQADLHTASVPLTWHKGMPVLGEAERLEADLRLAAEVLVPGEAEPG